MPTKVLEYTEWRNFCKIIEKAKEACKKSSNDILDHFVDVNKMVRAGVAEKAIDDIILSRYACYLIVMKGIKFKLVEFDQFKSEAGTNSFVLSFQKHRMCHYYKPFSRSVILTVL